MAPRFLKFLFGSGRTTTSRERGIHGSGLLNLGCGSTFHPEWNNFDLTPADPTIGCLDLTPPLPFADEACRVCYSSHVLEHFPRSLAPRFLAELHRILKPGGIVRVVVPDLEKIARGYLRELEDALAGVPGAGSRHEWMCLELLDQMTRTFSGGFMGRLWRTSPLEARSLIVERSGHEAEKWISFFEKEFQSGAQPLSRTDLYAVEEDGHEEQARFRSLGENHRWMYDGHSLAVLLREAGFQEVRICSASESSIPGFSGYRLDTDEKGAVRKPDSLFMEGKK